MSNRIIKFRGKRVDNGEWVEGLLCPRSLFKDPDFLEDTWIATGFEDEAYAVDPDTVTSDASDTIKDLRRRLKSHQQGQAVVLFCQKCTKRIWFVDDERMECPFCGEHGLHIADIDAEVIGTTHDKEKPNE